jgi:hypothetical protein
VSIQASKKVEVMLLAKKSSLLLTIGWMLMLAGCRSPEPVPINPMSSEYKSETPFDSVVESSTTVEEPVEVAAVPSQHKAPLPAKSSDCPPIKWRTLPNTAFPDAERWEFTVRWGVVKAGRAVLAVEGIETIRNRPAYHLSMDIFTTGTASKVHSYRDRTETWLDKASLTTVLARESIRESDFQLEEIVVLDPVCQRFTKVKNRLDKHEQKTRKGPLPSDSVDIYGALYYLRTQALTPGKTFDFSLFTGDKSVPATAQVQEIETIKVPAGKFECLRIDLSTKDPEAAKKVGNIQWWVTDDQAHRPIRIRMDLPFGHINAELD